MTEMVPWNAATFPSKEARDGFLSAVATLPADAVESALMDDLGTGALIRWRPGHFLAVNDIAYAHGGRIILAARVAKRPATTLRGLDIAMGHGLGAARSR